MSRPAFELERFKGCVPTPLVNQHSETPAQTKEAIETEGLYPAPAWHSRDRQLSPKAQAPLAPQLYR